MKIYVIGVRLGIFDESMENIRFGLTKSWSALR